MINRRTISLALILYFFLSIFIVKAQGTRRPAIITSLTKNNYNEGKIEISQDRRIDDLMVKYIDSNIKKGTITGYRIVIFSESKQSIAEKNARETRQKFISNFPNEEAIYRWEAPDWLVFVGNFRTYTDAYRLKKQIESMYPNAFIRETQIEYTKF